jgi:hypothetical protein
MAFGKQPVSRLAPEVRAKLEENRTDRVVHQTEVKMLKAIAPDSPLGDAALLAAMTGAVDLVCNKCRQEKTDLVLALTGTCESCHNLELLG